MANGDPGINFPCTCQDKLRTLSGGVPICPIHDAPVRWSSVWEDGLKPLTGTLTTTKDEMVWISAEELEDLHDAIDALQVKLRIARGEEEVFDWEMFESQFEEDEDGKD